MTILKLLKGLNIEWQTGPGDVEIKGIAYDSRLVEKDFLFVAVRGFSKDGHDYIKDAVNRGATVVVAEHPADITRGIQNGSLRETTFLGVSDSREALALISSAFYGHPADSLALIGITGTNGKTTTGFITKNIIDAGGSRAGLLGTICYMTGDKISAAINTTPESSDLQRYLREMVDNNMKYAVLEVSSHALVLDRIKGCSFQVAAFTNFSQDHLDFHTTMDEYFNVKRTLFDYLDTGGTAVLNRDDPRIRSLEKELDCNVITCGIEAGAMIRAENICVQKNRSPDAPSVPRPLKGERAGLGQLSFDVQTPDTKYSIYSELIGRFNVYNILMSIGIAYALGIKQDVIQHGVRRSTPVAGRFENVNEGQDFLCIVDYAHTEDALRKVIEEARHITRERIITVFGCGGDRDRTKRPLMAAAADELSDIVVITSDNPRSEDPSAIIRDIVSGIGTNNYISLPDREEAINVAVSMAQEGDTVLIAGKGHETYQEIKGVRHHFSDREILRKAIRKRLAVSG